MCKFMENICLFLFWEFLENAKKHPCGEHFAAGVHSVFRYF